MPSLAVESPLRRPLPLRRLSAVAPCRPSPLSQLSCHRRAVHRRCAFHCHRAFHCCRAFHRCCCHQRCVTVAPSITVALSNVSRCRRAIHRRHRCAAVGRLLRSRHKLIVVFFPSSIAVVPSLPSPSSTLCHRRVIPGEAVIVTVVVIIVLPSTPPPPLPSVAASRPC
jgi:hypothetical protein